MIRPIATLVAGPRSKWAVLGVWIVLIGVLGGIGMKLPEVTTDDTAAALPENTQSGEVSRLLKDRFKGGETQPALVVFKRAGGLTDADRSLIAADATKAGN